jgi:ligand-binding sensor domain-containing protein
VAHIKKSINESESITADNHGGVWVTQSAEIRHYPDGFSFVLDPEVAGFRSYRIFADQRSNLWIATEDKLYLYDGKDLRLIASPPISPVGAMSAAPDGRLWFAGQRGVAVYDPAGDNQP